MYIVIILIIIHPGAYIYIYMVIILIIIIINILVNIIITHYPIPRLLVYHIKSHLRLDQRTEQNGFSPPSSLSKTFNMIWSNSQTPFNSQINYPHSSKFDKNYQGLNPNAVIMPAIMLC